MAHPLSVAFIWHMHQPPYRDLVSGECVMPWVRLHAAKDYVDMVARLEAFPTIHQTVNVVPSLLDQIEAYLPPTSQSDAFLDVSRKPAEALTDAERQFLLQWFFLANRERMIEPHARYRDLLAKRGGEIDPATLPDIQARFRTQDYLDLQVWFNLAWIDPALRRQDPNLLRLERKGGQFTEADKQRVLAAHQQLLARVIPLYRAAADRGQVELAASPYYHPILPLLCDVRSAHAALPQSSLPRQLFRHPEDARRQIQEGLARHAQAFGHPPAGMWPPEGSVSEAVAALALEAGIRWIATDEEILWRTLRAPRRAAALYRPHRLAQPQGELAMLFRDRELSDLIGFVYSRWDPRTAAEDFIRRLGRIQAEARNAPEPSLATVILDGENAWESYPDDGDAFLTALYGALAADPRFRCVTVSEFLASYPLAQTPPLPTLHSGSWINGDFATWIGHPEKNAAWDLLAEARDALQTPQGQQDAPPAAWQSLSAAEGSDWMWWFGDTHFSMQADEFDRLFRLHVANACRLAGAAVPEAATRPIRRPGQGSVTPPTDWIHPVIDGRDSSYYEWLFAGRIDALQRSGAIQRGESVLRRLQFGSDGAMAYLRLEVSRVALSQLGVWALQVSLGALSVRLAPGPDGAIRVAGADTAAVACACDAACELAVPLAALGVTAEQPTSLAITLLVEDRPVERAPAHDAYVITWAPAEAELRGW